MILFPMKWRKRKINFLVNSKKCSPTEFCGYDYYECKSKLNKIIIDDKFKNKTNNKDTNISLVFEKPLLCRIRRTGWRLWIYL